MNNKIPFFIVAGLTIITVIAILVANIWEIGDPSFRTWGTGVVLAEILGLFVYLTKAATKFKQVNIFLTFPEELQELSANVDWDYNQCYIIAFDLKKNIKLLKSDIGPGYRVHLDQNLISDILEKDVVEFELSDKSGRKWRVGPFNLYEKNRNIEIIEGINLDLDYD